VKNLYAWASARIALFQGGFTEIATAFFQNLLSKVISINSIYNSITASQQAGNTYNQYFDIARLCRILLDFQPIETGS
jgi:hypothetical protein